MIIKKLLNNINTQKENDRLARLYRNLIRHEARIGGTVFGPVPAGTRREFFCLDRHTWVWHEEWTDAQGQRHSKTTRYEVRPGGILKVQDGRYSPVSLDEATHLRDAAHLYIRRVRQELYSPAV